MYTNVALMHEILGCEREKQYQQQGLEVRLQINAATTLDGTVEEQLKTEDYEALNRLIDSVTRDFSRESVNSWLNALARKSRLATTICEHIPVEQRPSTILRHHLQSVKLRACSALAVKILNDKPFEEVTKHNILSYFNSFCKPTSVDPQHKWIGSFNNRLRYQAKFFTWLYIKKSARPPEANQPT